MTTEIPPPIDASAISWIAWASSFVPGALRAATPIRCNEHNQVFRLVFGSETLFLKIGPRLRNEYERLQWLAGRLPAPRPVGFASRDGQDILLTTALPGDDLADLAQTLAPQTVVTRLAQTLKTIHACPAADWPFGGDGPVLVHGDACLPNFLYQGDQLTGCIDIGEMALAHPDIDLAAAVWTLQRNLGPGYGLAFLHEYGRTDATATEVERLRLLYPG